MRKIFCATLIFGMITVAIATAAENMIGRQSQNEGLSVVPAPGPVAIDGKLDDWDLSGQIWSFADIAVRDAFSVKSAAMWDKDYLYLSFLWKDPMPLNSVVNPDFNPDKGWVADSVQLRIQAGEKPAWFTTWYHAPDKRAVLHRSYWLHPTADKQGQDERLLISKPGEVDLGEDAQLAYVSLPGGDGFIQEMRIPWKMFYNMSQHTPAVDDVFKLGLDFNWGAVTGQGWPMHRYADNMQPGATSREFYWTARSAWGDARLLDKGHLTPRRYIEGDAKLEGVVPVRAQLPGEAKDFDGITGFTLVIEDEQGNRIRNLAGDFDPREYAVTDAPAGTVEVLWDGLNDDGNLVPVGTYNVRGLTHGALKADYERSFYNPGTPPWAVTDGSGAWGADHATAQYITRAGDWVVLAWEFAEGGDGVIGVDRDGRKRWGDKRGAKALAADDRYVYILPNSWHTKEQTLMRLEAGSGKYAPFVLDGKARALELPIKEIVGEKARGDVVGLGADENTLALLFDSGDVALLDPASATLRKVCPAPESFEAGVKKGSPYEFTGMKNKPVYSLAFGPKGSVLIGFDGDLYHLETQSGNYRKETLPPAIGKLGALAFDKANNLLWIVDRGADQQVKAFHLDADKNTVTKTAGRKGGRPIRGAFDPEAMANVTGLAVDVHGNVWTTEYSEWPRRVSVWSPETGKLVRDYIGNTGYSGTAGFLHDQDPLRGFVGPLEFAFDPNSRGWSLKEIAWLADPEKGESFIIDARGHRHASVFRSKAGGMEREFLFAPRGRDWQGYSLFMWEGARWRPVAAIGTVGTAFGVLRHDGPIGAPAEGEFAKFNLFDGLIWNDQNNDGLVQVVECEIVPTDKPGDAKARGTTGLPLSNGWTARLDPVDMSFYVFSRDGIVEYKPVSFSAKGAPIYGQKGMRTIDFPVKNGEIVPVPGSETALVLYGGSTTVPGKMAGVSRKDGRYLWSYPSPYYSVHGSHRATMPKPGLLIGPLKVLGIVDADKPEGGFFGLRGNLGQDFYMTVDGLYIGSMFLDGRLPGMGLPPSEDELAAMPLEMFTNGGEPFNGWLGRQSDGVLRMTNGMPGQAVMVTRLRGFDSIRHFKAPAVALTETLREAAEKAGIARKQKEADKLEYALKRKPERDWQDIPTLEIRQLGQPSVARVQLAYDDACLYARFDVNDPSAWKNAGKDASLLFKTGDCVDIQLSPSGNTDNKAKEGDQRILIAPFAGKPTAVLMRQVDPTSGESKRTVYRSPVMERVFDRVEILDDVEIQVGVQGNRYVVEAAIPWNRLAMKPEPGKAIRGDVGFILSNEAGTQNTARVYWSNRNTNLVNDIPGEAVLEPGRWATLKFE